jgi:hypothetical protein
VSGHQLSKAPPRNPLESTAHEITRHSGIGELPVQTSSTTCTSPLNLPSSIDAKLIKDECDELNTVSFLSDTMMLDSLNTSADDDASCLALCIDALDSEHLPKPVEKLHT